MILDLKNRLYGASIAFGLLAGFASAQANVIGAQGGLMMQSVPALFTNDVKTKDPQDLSLFRNTFSDSSPDALLRDQDLNWILQPALNLLPHTTHVPFAKGLKVYVAPRDFESFVKSIQHPGIHQLLNVMQDDSPIEKDKIYQVKGADGKPYSFIILSTAEIIGDWQTNGDDIAGPHLAMFLGTKLGAALSKLHADEMATYKIDLSSYRIPKGERVRFTAGLMHGSTSNKFGKKITPKNVILPWNFSADDVEAGKTLGLSHLITRSLVNLPANHLNPLTYELFVLDLVEKVNEHYDLDGDFSVQVYDSEELARKNGNLLNGVGQGSMHKARIFQLMWRPNETEGKVLERNDKTGEILKIAVVGKGITHNSGGINVKGSGVENMHRDMGGSAVALSTAISSAVLGANKNVDVWLAVAENSISEYSYRPGDIITSAEGKAIYIGNTDAEGRLAMSTAIEFAAQAKSDIVFDLATLTGANAIATGQQVEGLFTNMGTKVARRIEDIGYTIGEMVSIQPLLNIYGKSLKHRRADYSNIGGSRLGSHITAALFLRLFLGKDAKGEETPWAHFDISTYTDTPCAVSAEVGACGRMSGMMSELVQRLTFKDGKPRF